MKTIIRIGGRQTGVEREDRLGKEGGGFLQRRGRSLLNCRGKGRYEEGKAEVVEISVSFKKEGYLNQVRKQRADAG